MVSLLLLMELARREREARPTLVKMQATVLTREQILAALKRGERHGEALHHRLKDLRPTAETMSLILGALLLVLGNLVTPLVTKAQDPLPLPSVDRKSTRLNSSHIQKSRMPSSA